MANRVFWEEIRVFGAGIRIFWVEIILSGLRVGE